jgi:hypothetical protein
MSSARLGDVLSVSLPVIFSVVLVAYLLTNTVLAVLRKHLNMMKVVTNLTFLILEGDRFIFALQNANSDASLSMRILLINLPKVMIAVYSLYLTLFWAQCFYGRAAVQQSPTLHASFRTVFTAITSWILCSTALCVLILLASHTPPVWKAVHNVLSIATAAFTAACIGTVLTLWGTNRTDLVSSGRFSPSIVFDSICQVLMLAVRLTLSLALSDPASQTDREADLVWGFLGGETIILLLAIAIVEDCAAWTMGGSSRFLL